MIALWLRGLLLRRAGRLAAVAGGIAVAVALLAALGSFLAASQATMTARAARSVSVDWQVEVQAGADATAVLDKTRAAPAVTVTAPVGYARASGLSSTTDGGTQTTGAAFVLGIPPDYRQQFPGVMRLLTGSDAGALLAQQTASNLHAKPGDSVQIARPGMAPVTVTVSGVVELPQADSLFQTVGAPAGSQPAAPPDNVVLLPAQAWHPAFDALSTLRPDLVRTQIHVARAHDLAPDPAVAYNDVTAAAHNLEAATAGTAVVGDNLGAALGAARGDAAYARVLFLFLGLPGAVLAALLTAAVTAAGATRRRSENALLKARGASGRQLLWLATVEAAAVGVAGSAAGLGVAAVIGQLAFDSAAFGATGVEAVSWAVASTVVGLVIAAATVLAPTWRDQRATVAAGRLTLGRAGGLWWARYGLDLGVLVLAGVVFWLSTSTGYQLVLAPEGVPSISVSYWAFFGPALLWVGAALLAWRLVDLVLGRGRRLVAVGLRPVAAGLSRTLASMLARQRRPLARAIVLLALAVSFAASTATFNATYRQQAEVDAQLTNGADVAVTESPGTSVGPAAAAQISTVAGVRAVEPIQHRFAYVGADLQDLYGVRPTTITGVTAVQDAYFQGGTAAQLLGRLAAAPDSVLVSAETVKDFQLEPGDLLNLRLQDGRTQQFTTVPFHYAGVVTEFPTAPKDSFFVANADYVAQRTGSDAVGAFLVDTGGTDSTAVAQRVSAQLGGSATVTDIAHARVAVGSSLTAVDLAGLTRLELGFALVLAAAAGGLVLALGLTERRRTFAIATALGANRGQLRAIVFGEAAVLTAGGLLAGAASGWGLSEMLVAVLSGVFDPPPSALAVPWGYLTAVGGITVAALVVAAGVAVRLAGRPAIATLREL